MAKDLPENPQDAEETAPAIRENFVARSRSGSFDSDDDLKGRLPKDILKNYECHQWKHAGAILATDFPKELDDIVKVLREVKLRKSFIVAGGGGKSKYAQAVDAAFKKRGWAGASRYRGRSGHAADLAGPRCGEW